MVRRSLFDTRKARAEGGDERKKDGHSRLDTCWRSPEETPVYLTGSRKTGGKEIKKRRGRRHVSSNTMANKIFQDNAVQREKFTI